ncbi:MAG TPA: hypothetical protein VEM40_08345 [Nitrospirota bacterium]|nr:hypothetical protein [Nitrospirota bacterium]
MTTAIIIIPHAIASAFYLLEEMAPVHMDGRRGAVKGLAGRGPFAELLLRARARVGACGSI